MGKRPCVDIDPEMYKRVEAAVAELTAIRAKRGHPPYPFRRFLWCALEEYLTQHGFGKGEADGPAD